MRETGVSGLKDRLRHSICGCEMLAGDWSDSAIGPIDRWPASLASLVTMLLVCPTPMVLAWGPERNAFYNDAFLPVLGPHAPGAMGRPFNELWGDLWAEIRPSVDATLTGESRRMIDLKLDLWRDGMPEEGWWTFTFSPVRDANGAIAGVIGLAGERQRDAIDQRPHRPAATGGTIGAWEWDVVVDRVTADARFASLHGLPPARMALGAPIAEIFAGIHAGDLPRVRAEIEEAMRSGGIFTSVYRLAGRDGAARRAIAQGRGVFDAGGRCIRFSGVSFDITDRFGVESDAREQGAYSLSR